MDPRQKGDESKREINKTRFQSIIDKFVEVGRFREADADEAARQYSRFIGNVAVKCPAEHRSGLLLVELIVYSTGTWQPAVHTAQSGLLLSKYYYYPTGSLL